MIYKHLIIYLKIFPLLSSKLFENCLLGINNHFSSANGDSFVELLGMISNNDNNFKSSCIYL